MRPAARAVPAPTQEAMDIFRREGLADQSHFNVLVHADWSFRFGLGREANPFPAKTHAQARRRWEWMYGVCEKQAHQAGHIPVLGAHYTAPEDTAEFEF